MIRFHDGTKRKFFVAWIAMGLVALSDGAMAAEDRPRVGLVLSGGGARGAAHIGVLEVLEEIRVPVDVVAGTSMGSIVGGLYALGLSPAELESAIDGIDWVQVFADEAPRQGRSFRRKEDDFGFLTNLRLSIKNGSVFVPSGVIRGQKLEFALHKLTLTSTRTARFDDLRLPFRAVATDIATGEARALDRGSLVTALRASMSIPAVFAPVEIDGRALVDGGIVMNMPIEVARAMGADVLIVVDVATPMRSPEELKSALAISAQVITIQTQQNQRAQLERLGDEDVVITPDLGELGTTSFQSLGDAVRVGREAALERVSRLEALILSEEEFARWRSTQRREPVELPVVDQVRIEGQTTLSATALRARVATRPGSQLDLSVLEDDLDRLYGTGAVEYARFDLDREGSDTVLTIRVVDRDRGRNALRFGLALDADLADEATFNLGVQHLWFPTNRLGGEMRTRGQIGRESGLRSEWFQPVDPAGHFFVSPIVEYNAGDLDTFNGSDRLARTDVRTAVGFLDFGVNLLNLAQLRAGIGYLHVETDLATGASEQLSDRDIGGGLIRARFLYDNLDDLSFPNDGSLLGVTATVFPESMGWQGQYATIEGSWAGFRTFSRTTFGLVASYSTTIDGNDQPQTVLTRGGLFDLGAFRRQERFGAHSGLASLNVYRRLASPTVLSFQFPLYIGIVGELGGAWEERSDTFEEVDYSVSPFVGLQTPLGPLFVAYSYGSGNRQRGYVRLGRGF